MKYRFTALLLTALLSVWAAAQSTTQVSGVVYLDANKNGIRDVNEKGAYRVRVSNGRDIVATDQEGKYTLPINGDANIFVIKPAGYTFLKDNQNRFKFFFIHRPNGSPEMKFPTLAPTKLPASLDFGLIADPAESKNNVRVLLFGDPQINPRTLNLFANDVVTELVGTKADFLVTLGDNVAERLGMFDILGDVVKQIGVPWRPVPGNHDENYDTLGDKYALETYIKNYGPQYYSFEQGLAHFIVIDDINWIRESMEKNGTYNCALGEDQMAFIKNDLARVPKDKLIVFFMHIPIVQLKERNELFNILKDYPHTLSVAGHTHSQYDAFLNKEDGWKGKGAHHLHVQGATCGAWWGGVEDEYGLSHAGNLDATPNGYSFLDITGNQYKIKFYASRRPADFQMAIWTPFEMITQESDTTAAYVNIFAGNNKTKITMTLDDTVVLNPVKTLEPDPRGVRQQQWEKDANSKLVGVSLMTRDCRHLWKAELPKGLKLGYHKITVKAVDMYGFTFTGNQMFKIIKEKEE